MDSGFHTVDYGFRRLDSGFQAYGFQIPNFLWFRIPKFQSCLENFHCGMALFYLQSLLLLFPSLVTLNKLSAGALANALTENINRKRYLLVPIDGSRPPVIGRHHTRLLKRQRPPKLPTGWLNIGWGPDFGALGPGSITSRTNTQGLKITE